MAYIEMSFKAESLKRWTEVLVVLPLEGEETPDRKKPEKFPTLYLLHGHSGNAKDWVTYSNIRRLAEERNLAVVMPTGENSFYVDNEELGLYSGSYIKELVEFTRKAFPLSQKREETFIGGLSMGGFGAMRNGMHYAELFSKIISLSGAFILEDLIHAKEGAPTVIESYEYFLRIFGNLEMVEKTDKNPLYCVREAQKRNTVPAVYMACGTEDYLIENNRHMKAELEKLGVPLTYHEAAGIHDWKFWDEWIEKALDWLLE